MKAVFTLWKQPMDDGLMHCGFNSTVDLATSFVLAVEVARNHYPEIELVTDDSGKALLIDHLNIPFSNVNLALNDYRYLPIHHWAYPKMIAYGLQQKPFIHLDYDVFLWDGIPKEMRKNALTFQNIEEGHIFRDHYMSGIEVFNNAPVAPENIKKNYTQEVFNCGVVMANDIDFVQEWWEAAKLYVEAPENQVMWTDMNVLYRSNHNLIFEQWFPGCIAKRRKMKIGEDIRFLLHAGTPPDFKYTHTLGPAKREANIAALVAGRVAADYPQYLKALRNLEPVPAAV